MYCGLQQCRAPGPREISLRNSKGFILGGFVPARDRDEQSQQSTLGTPLVSSAICAAVRSSALELRFALLRIE